VYDARLNNATSPVPGGVVVPDQFPPTDHDVEGLPAPVHVITSADAGNPNPIPATATPIAAANMLLIFREPARSADTLIQSSKTRKPFPERRAPGRRLQLMPATPFSHLAFRIERPANDGLTDRATRPPLYARALVTLRSNI
jgi:hypothetical protein